MQPVTLVGGWRGNEGKEVTKGGAQVVEEYYRNSDEHLNAKARHLWVIVSLAKRLYANPLAALPACLRKLAHHVAHAVRLDRHFL